MIPKLSKKPHGIRGEVVVDFRCDLREEVRAGCELRVVGNGGDEKFLRIVDVKGSRERPIVRFEGFETREEAERLRSRTVWMGRESSRSPGPDRWFVQDIIGVEVRTDDGEFLGTVTDIMHSPANDVYVVRGLEGEILLPAIDDVVREVDVEAGSMIVHLIEGLR